MALSIVAVQAAGCLPALFAASARLQGVLSHAAKNGLTSYQCSRGCTNHALTSAKAAGTGANGYGNVYPTLTEEQLEAIKRRRITSNCSAEQLSHKQIDAHQTKHIMMCTGSNCNAACRSCGTCGGQLGNRAWEYLEKRLKEINQLRSENDQEEPILGSCIDCIQAHNLLPPLAATEPCHGPIAVVYPEGIWYERLTPLVLERIIEEHLLGGHVVGSHVMMGSRTFGDHNPMVLPALDITRRATPTGHFACHYAW